MRSLLGVVALGTSGSFGRAGKWFCGLHVDTDIPSCPVGCDWLCCARLQLRHRQVRESEGGVAVDGRSDEIFLETINPFDLTPDDLVAIGEAISNATGIVANPAYEDQHGAGVSWYEVLYVWLPSADFVKDAAWDRVLDVVLDKMRERFRRRGNERRPKSVVIREQGTGRLVEGWVIATIDSKAVKESDPDTSPRRMPPPRKRRN